ncbi:MAG: hypothetical protein CL610_09385 [Anaerolineaceae bacterium]|nr:hypothetical protein [Anaerolineaceae bacterium]
MKKYPIHHAVLLLCALLLVVFPANAQSENLLQNPGFEAPFQTLDGDPPRQVAEGWTPWHVPAAPDAPSYANRQPEYEPAAPDTSRILEGENAQLLRSFFATHEGGVYQQVSGVSAGTTLTFRVSAYVWSNTFDNVDASEEDGDVFVQVGIDPTGGTDPQSSDIVWSEAGIEQYDAYNEYAVEAEATGDTVTVFVRTTIGVPVKNSHIYLDAASLAAGDVVMTEEPAETETLEPTVETEEPTETEVVATEETDEPVETEVVVPTVEEATEGPDEFEQTATAIIAEATQTAVANETATADVPTETETSEPTATETETATEPAETDTVEPATETPTGPDPLQQTATALISIATETASAALTSTADVPSATETDDPIFLTATAIIDAQTATAQVTVTATVEESEITATPTTSSIDEMFPYTITHTVQSGETVAILAQRYGSTIEAIDEANSLNGDYLLQVGQELIIPVRELTTPEPTGTSAPVVTATPIPTTPVPVTQTIYIVQRGDSLSRIARQFDTTVNALAQLNGIVNINRIQVGQRLRIPGVPTPVPPAPQPTVAPPQQGGSNPPPQATYIVRPGDSLYRISLLYGVSIARIAQANNLVNLNRIYVGQSLVIP